MFKKLFVLMVLAATFLGGYYLGREPGSPDIFAAVRDGYEKAAQLGEIFGAADDEGIRAFNALTNRQASDQSTPPAPADDASSRLR